MEFEIEEIPDSNLLFYRVHKNYFFDNEIIPGAFSETGQGEGRGMSTDWEKYATAQETRARGAKSKENYAVLSFVTGTLRKELDLTVRHSPSKTNRAHSLVNGIDTEKPKKEKIRLKLLDILKWEINNDI